MNDTINPSHYMHPTITGLEARHVIENLPYHIATAIAYLWRCGRKEGSPPIDDLRKSKMHLGFELDRIEIYGTAHSQPSLPLFSHRLRAITDPFAPNIAMVFYYLLGCEADPHYIKDAIQHIDQEIASLHEQ